MTFWAWVGLAALVVGLLGVISSFIDHRRERGLSLELAELARLTYRNARRAVVLAFGSTVLLIGVALLVLPGPGIPIMLLGLAILATEFVWARALLKRAREEAERLARATRRAFERD